MTRKNIEEVFARIPQEVETEIWGVTSWGDSWCEIYVNCGRRSKSSVGTWERVAFESDDCDDDGGTRKLRIVDNFDDIIAKALRFANKKNSNGMD